MDKIIKNSQQELKEMEKLLINNDCVFLSALENNFYIYLAEFKKKIYQQMKQEGFFDGDPEKVRQKWLGIFIFIQIVASVVMFIFTIQTYNFFPFIILGLGLVPGIILSLSMPRRVPKGYSLFRQIEGLRWYLNKGKWRYEVQEKELFIEE